MGKVTKPERTARTGRVPRSPSATLPCRRGSLARPLPQSPCPARPACQMRTIDPDHAQALPSPKLLCSKTFQPHHRPARKYLLCLSATSPGGSLTDANQNSITTLSALTRFLFEAGLRRKRWTETCLMGTKPPDCCGTFQERTRALFTETDERL